MEEVWKELDDAPFEFSSLGRLRHSKGNHNVPAGYLMAPQTNGNRYFYALKVNGINRSFYLRLLNEQFFPDMTIGFSLNEWYHLVMSMNKEENKKLRAQRQYETKMRRERRRRERLAQEKGIKPAPVVSEKPEPLVIVQPIFDKLALNNDPNYNPL